MTRRAWGRLTLGVLVVGLPLGRWLALRTVDRSWATSLGVEVTHTAIANLRVVLLLLAFAAAAAWAVGNLYFLYRSIGSVHVPRRLGNIEILEAVPRAYLQVIMLALGGLLAAALSFEAREWWREFALMDAAAALAGSDRDPALGRDVSYYLFTLPWQRRIVGFLTRLTASVLVVTGALHLLIGAVRWNGRRLETTPLARAHLAVQLAALAAALFVGLRLDPAEYVAGLKNVPYDAVLMDIRLPVAALLSGLSLASGITALAWIRIPRLAVTAVPWGVLAVAAVVGTYIVPGFAAAARSPEQRLRPDLVEAQRRLLGQALALRITERTVSAPTSPNLAVLDRHGTALGAIPIWEPGVLHAILGGAAAGPPEERWTEPSLALYPDPAGHVVPVFLSVRERDLMAGRPEGGAVTWKDAHAGQAAYGTGAAAVAAHRASTSGMPAFVPRLSRPDSTTPNVGPVELSVNRIAFSPGAEPYALWTADESGPAPAGVPVQGGARRLAFAWALQTTRVLSTDNVPRGALLLWPRGVAERLERFVPFARFGAPYPVVNRGRVIWLAPGYVTASAYPLSVVADMAGRRARFMSASLLGVVDAAAGSTAVYLLPDADLLARAWAQFAPDAVRGPDQLPADLLPHLRYPEELFAAQLAVALRGGADGLPTPPSRREAADQRPAWLPAAVVEAAPGGLALHAVAAGEAGALEATLDGVMDRGIARLVLTRLREPRAPRPLPLPTDVAAGRSHILAFPEGVVRITPAFRASGSDGGEVPRFGDVTVEVGEAVGRGATLAEALLRLRLAIGSAPGTGAQWAEARRWFARMDQARRSGDWADFGRAWRELERLLGVPADTTR